jgi:hypothetical protein
MVEEAPCFDWVSVENGTHAIAEAASLSSSTTARSAVETSALTSDTHAVIIRLEVTVVIKHIAGVKQNDLEKKIWIVRAVQPTL